MTKKIKTAAVVAVFLATALLTQPVAASPMPPLAGWTESLFTSVMEVVGWFFPQPDPVGSDISGAATDSSDADIPDLFPEPDPVG